MEESGEEEAEVELEVAGQPCPAADAEQVAEVATIGDEHVAGELVPEGVPESTDGVGFGDGAIKGRPILLVRDTVSLDLAHFWRSLDSCMTFG